MVDYAPGKTIPTTLIYGVPVSRRADGFYGVAAGQIYDLIVSLQRHATNPVAIELRNMTITVVDGAGKGQTATITGYDAETNSFTISSPAGRGSTRRAASRSRTAPPPATATDDGRLPGRADGRPGLAGRDRRAAAADADVRLEPGVQPGRRQRRGERGPGRVATQRARFKLTGTPTPGETWSVWLDGVDARRVHGRPSSDTLATIAQALCDQVDPESGTCADDRRCHRLPGLHGRHRGLRRHARERPLLRGADHRPRQPRDLRRQRPPSRRRELTVELGGFPAEHERWTLTARRRRLLLRRRLPRGPRQIASRRSARQLRRATPTTSSSPAAR